MTTSLRPFSSEAPVPERSAETQGMWRLLADMVRAAVASTAGRPREATGPAVATTFRCVACGHSAAHELFPAAVPESRGYQPVRCDRCGLVATHPPAPRESLPAFYGHTYYGPEHAKFGPLTHAFVLLFRVARVRALRMAGVERGTVLDLGCGNGDFLRVLERFGYAGFGTELSAESAEVARRTFGDRVRVGALQGAGFAPGQFDAITAWHVFEHLPDPRETLAECHRLLRPGGALVLAVPNISSCQARWARAGWFHLDLPRHLFHYDPGILASLLSAHGFEVVHLSHWSLEQNPFGAIQSALHRLGGAHFGLYNRLRGPLGDARRRGRRLPGYAAYLAAFPLAAVATYLGSLLGSGATFTVLARRRSE